MRSRFERQQPEKLLVTVREAANMLGLSMSTIRRYMDSGVLRDVRIGKRRMFHVRTIVSFAESGLSLDQLRRVRAAVSDNQQGVSSDSI